MPLERLCLESDSPALGPPHSDRNEPMNIAIPAAFIAQVKGCSLDRVLHETTANARRLFPLLQ